MPPFYGRLSHSGLVMSSSTLSSADVFLDQFQVRQGLANRFPQFPFLRIVILSAISKPDPEVGDEN
jgi:hypothetical protein